MHISHLEGLGGMVLDGGIDVDGVNLGILQEIFVVDVAFCDAESVGDLDQCCQVGKFDSPALHPGAIQGKEGIKLCSIVCSGAIVLQAQRAKHIQSRIWL